jgi:hypothetical protein
VGRDINGFPVREAYLLLFSFGGSDVFLKQDKDCDGMIRSTKHADSGKCLEMFSVCALVLRILKQSKACRPHDLKWKMALSVSAKAVRIGK